EIPAFSEPASAGARAFHPLGEQSRYIYTYAPLARRTHDLVLPPPRRERTTEKAELPAGAELPGMPPSAEWNGRFGAFSSTVSLERGRLVVRRELELSTSQITPEDYPDFREFLRKVDSLAAPRILFRTGDPDPAG